MQPWLRHWFQVMNFINIYKLKSLAIVWLLAKRRRATPHDVPTQDDGQIERVQFQRRATQRAVWTGLKPECSTAAGS